MRFRLLILSCATFALIILPSSMVSASVDLTVSGSGCFVRASDVTTSTYTVRMQTPSCSIQVEHTGLENQVATFVLENIDPDFVTVDTYDEDPGLNKTENTLQFNSTLEPGSTTIAIEPWYTYDDDFYFVAISDNQAKGTIDVNPIFQQMLRQIESVNPPFFINAGDLVQGSSVTETMNQMYQAVISELEENAVTMYPVPGNHDRYEALQPYQEYFGPIDYRFDFGNIRFIGLSTVGTESRGGITSAQLEWLDEAMSTANKRVIPYFHHPLLKPTWATNPLCCFQDMNDRDQLASTLSNNNVALTIVGHSQGYDYTQLEASDISTVSNPFYQLITGGAGGNLAQPDGTYHFVIVHVTADEITHTKVEYDVFDTVIDYTNNDGTSSIASAEVANQAAVDLPYIRLKFKLDTELETTLISDDAGTYYTGQYTKALDDYAVTYLETEIDALTERTFTAQPSNVLHTETTNTVDTTGAVTFDTQPTSTEQAVAGFTAIPKVSTTNISNIVLDTSSRQEHQWTETPAAAGITTTYSLSNMPARRLYEVSVNGSVYTKAGTDESGILQFAYEDTAATRNFSSIIKQ